MIITVGLHCTGNLIDYSQKIISIFPVLFFSLFFFLFSTRHPAFKSQEHRFPTIYFKPVSWITFYLLLSILKLTKNLSFLCGCHGKARLLLVIIRKYTSVALFMRIHEHVYRQPFILSAFHRTHLKVLVPLLVHWRYWNFNNNCFFFYPKLGGMKFEM